MVVESCEKYKYSQIDHLLNKLLKEMEVTCQ